MGKTRDTNLFSSCKLGGKGDKSSSFNPVTGKCWDEEVWVQGWISIFSQMMGGGLGGSLFLSLFALDPLLCDSIPNISSFLHTSTHVHDAFNRIHPQLKLYVPKLCGPNLWNNQISHPAVPSALANRGVCASGMHFRVQALVTIPVAPTRPKPSSLHPSNGPWSYPASGTTCSSGFPAAQWLQNWPAAGEQSSHPGLKDSWRWNGYLPGRVFAWDIPWMTEEPGVRKELGFTT